MPLPLRQLRVLPNPWCFWTLQNGPQGALAFSDRAIGPLKYLGAKPKDVVREVRPEGDPRGNDTKYSFSWPGLNPDLVTGTPLEFAAHNEFIRDRLQDGSLVPADEATAKASGALYPNIEAAREVCIRDFEAHYGSGSFAEAFKGKPFVPGAKPAAPTTTSPTVETTAPSEQTSTSEPSEPTKPRGGKS